MLKTQIAAMRETTTMLNDGERKICADLGISEAEYRAAKRARQGRAGGGDHAFAADARGRSERSMVDAAVERMMVPMLRDLAEARTGGGGAQAREIRTALGIGDAELSDFEAHRMVATVRGGTRFVPAQMARNQTGASGIIGPGIVKEAFYEHRPEIESTEATAEQLAAEAASAIEDFQKKPAAPDAWKIVARAAAFLTGVLDLIGPAYVDRVDTKKGKWK